MSRRLPPLNALRAFEAAARHLSFTLAADELSVTQAAVSHQVKSLETYLGVALFRRVNRGLLLTDEGQFLSRPVGDALDTIADAVHGLHARDHSGVLTVSTLDSFAGAWLVQRLRRFRAAYPDIDVRISTSDGLVDFARDGIDIAIRYGPGTWPRVEAVLLMKEDFFPVCSPALLASGAPLKKPDDLRYHTLIHDDMELNWDMWLKAAGVEGFDARRGPAYNHSNLVIQAAIAGEGVALGRSAMIVESLAEGRLVKPFDLDMPARNSYYIVYPKSAVTKPMVAAFRDWLLGEAKAEAEAEAEAKNSPAG